MSDEVVVGRVIGPDANGWHQATGPCCDHPDWILASHVADSHRLPCRACGQGVMVVTEHSIH